MSCAHCMSTPKHCYLGVGTCASTRLQPFMNGSKFLAVNSKYIGFKVWHRHQFGWHHRTLHLIPTACELLAVGWRGMNCCGCNAGSRDVQGELDCLEAPSTAEDALHS